RGLGIELREGVDVADQIVGSGFSSIELRNKAFSLCSRLMNLADFGESKAFQPYYSINSCSITYFNLNVDSKQNTYKMHI
ncbi:hypothetical protein, partial [Vibrio lentus]|uniref:hypothetical protein n=1 Tax=Vibrio lentus TaxID=136468 RepID=UPI001A7E093A